MTLPRKSSVLRRTDYKRQRAFFEARAGRCSVEANVEVAVGASIQASVQATVKSTVELNADQSLSNNRVHPLEESINNRLIGNERNIFATAQSTLSYLDAECRLRNPFELLLAVEELVGAKSLLESDYSTQPSLNDLRTIPEIVRLSTEFLSLKDGLRSIHDHNSIESGDDDEVDEWANAHMEGEHSDMEVVYDSSDEHVQISSIPISPTNQSMNDQLPSLPSLIQSTNAIVPSEQLPWTVYTSAIINSTQPLLNSTDLLSILLPLQLSDQLSSTPFSSLCTSLVSYICPDRPIPPTSAITMARLLQQTSIDTQLDQASREELQWYRTMESQWCTALDALTTGITKGIINYFYYTHEKHFAVLARSISNGSIEVLLNRTTIGLRRKLDSLGIKYRLSLHEQRRPKTISREYQLNDGDDEEKDLNMNELENLTPLLSTPIDNSKDSMACITDICSVELFFTFLRTFSSWNASGLSNVDIQLPLLVCPRPFIHACVRMPTITQKEKVQVISLDGHGTKQTCQLRIDGVLLPEAATRLLQSFNKWGEVSLRSDDRLQF